MNWLSARVRNASPSSPPHCQASRRYVETLVRLPAGRATAIFCWPRLFPESWHACRQTFAPATTLVYLHAGGDECTVALRPFVLAELSSVLCSCVGPGAVATTFASRPFGRTPQMTPTLRRCFEVNNFSIGEKLDEGHFVFSKTQNVTDVESRHHRDLSVT
jgi:hypothetical protein